MNYNKNSHITPWEGPLSKSDCERTDLSQTPAHSHSGSAYDRITQRIMDLLNAGSIPWCKPWNVVLAFPRNLITRRAYQGINVFLLLAMDYESPYWLTFNQISRLGGNVRKREKACPVVFWKQMTIDDEETGEEKDIPLLRFYHLFNIDHCEGLRKISKIQAVPVLLPTKPAAIVENMPQGPVIKHGMTRAFYSPSSDFIGMPCPEHFDLGEAYFSTLFHELIHATGAASRLNRATVTGGSGFGSTPYCKEELIAEMGAAFLCGHAMIAQRTLENSAAYIHNWLEQLRGDKKLIVQAAAQAQKAADFILGTQFRQAQAPQEGGNGHE